MALACDVHPAELAAYVCDGCKKYLCIDCTTAGKALTFCKHCGELAVEVDEIGRVAAPAAPAEPTRQAGVAYGMGEAFLYPFRGLQLGIFVAFFVLFGAIEAAVAAADEASCLFDPARFGLLLGLVAVFADIVRTTAEGERSLESLPDYRNIFRRIAEVLSFLVLGLLSLALIAFLTAISGCFDALAPDVSFGPHCAVALAAGLWASVLFLVFGFGSSSVFETFLHCVRFDLHWQALRSARTDALRLSGMIAGLLLAAVGCWALPAGLALGLVKAAIGLYAAFTGFHLAGLLYRWHVKALTGIYE